MTKKELLEIASERYCLEPKEIESIRKNFMGKMFKLIKDCEIEIENTLTMTNKKEPIFDVKYNNLHICYI